MTERLFVQTVNKLRGDCCKRYLLLDGEQFKRRRGSRSQPSEKRLGLKSINPQGLIERHQFHTIRDSGFYKENQGNHSPRHRGDKSVQGDTVAAWKVPTLHQGSVSMS